MLSLIRWCNIWVVEEAVLLPATSGLEQRVYFTPFLSLLCALVTPMRRCMRWCFLLRVDKCCFHFRDSCHQEWGSGRFCWCAAPREHTKNNNKRQLQNDKLVEKSRNFCYLEFCPKMRLFKVIFQDYELQEFPLVTMQWEEPTGKVHPKL